MGVVDGYRSGAERVSAAGVDREWTIRENGTADLYARIELDGAFGGGPGRERFRVRISWVEEDGEWRIAEVSPLEELAFARRHDQQRALSESRAGERQRELEARDIGGVEITAGIPGENADSKRL